MTDVPAITRIYGIHKPYVPLGELDDHLRLGWMPLPHLGAAYEGAVHCVWACACKMVVPAGNP